jgi:hypothetical protein
MYFFYVQFERNIIPDKITITEKTLIKNDLTGL